VYFIDMFQRLVGPLDVIGVAFRHQGYICCNWKTLTRDSDHAKCKYRIAGQRRRLSCRQRRCLYNLFTRHARVKF